MLHFRTLDWGMDGLRKLVVRLEYVKDGQRIGTTVGYVGFVGILTAVRKDLSLSLNFRPNRNCISFLSSLGFYFHLLESARCFRITALYCIEPSSLFLFSEFPVKRGRNVHLHANYSCLYHSQRREKHGSHGERRTLSSHAPIPRLPCCHKP